MMGLADPGVKQPEGPRRRPPKLGRAPRSGHGGEWYARLWTLSNEPQIGQTFDTSRADSDRAGLHEEDERGPGKPAQQCQLGRPGHRERPGQDGVENEAQDQGCARLREP